ncbi:hypothetical protein C0Z01_02865 [Photobacterium kishitanii]|uniref:Uncharacterized protein n=1 Tax=Photobacterium kishitanii TaxID=318456 RepID=A0A0B7JHF1_9GAMM|nr:hypothetical protein [Photobacterium kishitanii]OBU23826.1 hypothetical protein AYY22_05650 [Photobacterium kishitanii]PSU91803.1 hypothetical protein C0W42_03860 [Photobacterium kishitanii]PSU92510.1 hypothetical protein C9J27_22230 [Photobacterium kishitanii]PSU93036.1 hypothetical protein C0W35_13515 [Photobacterium kishitanii]PSV20307.1 hypothetical protein C0W28_09290 [Photobacterium kishitanii]
MYELLDWLVNKVVFVVFVIIGHFQFMTIEAWSLIISLGIGILALSLSYWHKKVMQQIARERGIFIHE